MYRNLIKWSLREFSSLPWRHYRNLYHTLISEFMLQQTTVATVIPKFYSFIEKFPTLDSLARANEGEVLKMWSGLGYYRRAKSLHQCAQTVFNNFRGKIPKNIDELLSIPGIGPYTAHAICTIGHNLEGIAVDANIERVLSRVYGLREMKGIALQNQIRDLFSRKNILYEEGPLKGRHINEALMDLGREKCKAKKTDCASCPLNSICVAYLKNKISLFPVVLEKTVKQKREELSLLRVYYEKNKKLLVYKKSQNEWLSGQFEVPTFVLNKKTFSQYPILKKKIDEKKLVTFKSSITKYTITNYIYKISDSELKHWKELCSRAVMIDHQCKSSVLAVSVKKLYAAMGVL